MKNWKLKIDTLVVKSKFTSSNFVNELTLTIDGDVDQPIMQYRFESRWAHPEGFTEAIY